MRVCSFSVHCHAGRSTGVRVSPESVRVRDRPPVPACAHVLAATTLSAHGRSTDSFDEHVRVRMQVGTDGASDDSIGSALALRAPCPRPLRTAVVAARRLAAAAPMSSAATDTDRQIGCEQRSTDAQSSALRQGRRRKRNHGSSACGKCRVATRDEQAREHVRDSATTRAIERHATELLQAWTERMSKGEVIGKA
eukprot:6203887-Pleurochrysis_carterae.AAC.2